MGNVSIKSMTCQHCSPDITKKIPPGDTHERLICNHCDHIFYENPKIITGIIPTFEDKILICKRNIEPKKIIGRCHQGIWK